VKVDCGCDEDYFAYVYPAQPYTIYVCNAFWTAPMTGTDSKGGTLLHEMSHFDIVAGTDDHVYGQSGGGRDGAHGAAAGHQQRRLARVLRGEFAATQLTFVNTR
jgi:hypothetical protein